MLTRRTFITHCAATSDTVALASADRHDLKAARLHRGVGLISPASAAFQREEVDIVVDAVRGLVVRHTNFDRWIFSASPCPVRLCVDPHPSNFMWSSTRAGSLCCAPHLLDHYGYLGRKDTDRRVQLV